MGERVRRTFADPNVARKAVLPSGHEDGWMRSRCDADTVLALVRMYA